MESKLKYSYEDFQAARAVDLVDVAEALGYTPQKVGHYHTLKEMDSVRIYNRKSWYRFSRVYDKGENGGSTIDFLKVFAGMRITEAVKWLLDFSGNRTRMEISNTTSGHNVQKSEEKPAPREFVLPPPENKYRRLYAYLIHSRGIPAETVDFFVGNKLIYEEAAHHNIVFLGKDVKGKVRFASMRGTVNLDGKAFKCDVPGSDKKYGFNLVNRESNVIEVFEAAIDMMSYHAIYSKVQNKMDNMLALGMLHDAPLETFLAENPNIKTIRFCLDNDKPGRDATIKLMEKYSQRGYEVVDFHVPKAFKDCNDFLCNKPMQEIQEAKILTEATPKKEVNRATAGR